MTQETSDQPGRDAVFLFPVSKRAPYSVEYGFERDAAFRVSLGIEKDFRVHDAVFDGTLQTSGCQILKILLRNGMMFQIIMTKI